jgi:hypothetical protein
MRVGDGRTRIDSQGEVAMAREQRLKSAAVRALA